MTSKRSLRGTLRTLRESHRQYSGWYGSDSIQAQRVARMIQETEEKLRSGL